MKTPEVWQEVWHNNLDFPIMILPPTFSSDNNINAIVETPRGSRNKYNYHEETGLFFLKKILPVGFSFPLDFGFIPHTMAGDDDPLDIIVFTEEAAFPGCLVECRVIGIMKAEQKKNNKTIRNDRVLGVAVASTIFSSIKDVSDLNKETIQDLVRFFETYHLKQKDDFKVISIDGAKEAIRLIKENLQS